MRVTCDYSPASVTLHGNMAALEAVKALSFLRHAAEVTGAVAGVDLTREIVVFLFVPLMITVGIRCFNGEKTMAKKKTSQGKREEECKIPPPGLLLLLFRYSLELPRPTSSLLPWCRPN